jgi:predicted dehydrogenase
MLSFGMIGASSIGSAALLEPAARRDDVSVVRVAARRSGAAMAYASAWGVPNSSTGYEEVLDDPEVHAVYISNAAADHAHWTVEALQAGKHVLCEKPIAVSREQARAVRRAASARGRVVMEGFHYRFHPLFGVIADLVTSGRFGRLDAIRSTVNGKRAYDPASILQSKPAGGGALLHNGVYAVHWSRLLFDAEPLTARASQRLNPTGADSDTAAELEFPGGRSAIVHCSFDRDDPVSVTLSFASAQVVTTGVIAPHLGHSLRVVPHVGPSTVMTVAGASSFDYQLAEFVHRVAAADAGPEPAAAHDRGDDIEGNLAAIDAIRLAASTCEVEEINPAEAERDGS